MNLGLGTLSELKAHLLNAALLSGTDYDGAIAALGRGVAGRFDKFTNRTLARAEAALYVGPADSAHLTLDRYPIEEVTKIELRESYADGWVDQGAVNDVLENINDAAGLLSFGAPLSALGTARLRVTFTGGYWIDLSADGTPTGSRTFQSANAVALTASAESLAITFPADFLAVPNIAVRIIPPAGGLIIDAVATVKTVSGFTAIFAYPIPSTDYTLEWEASATAAGATPDSSLPTGATALPDEIKYAWLTQCKHIFAKSDALGLEIARDKSALEANAIELLPGVKELLRDHIRYALT